MPSVNRDQAFDKMKELLRTNRGIFIGETHHNMVSTLFVQTHIAQLKAMGVTTLYVELDPYEAAAQHGGVRGKNSCLASFAANNNGYAPGFEGPITYATAAGLRVIGYDDVTDLGRQQVGSNPAMRNELATSDAAMKRRNAFGARLINATQDGGKFIVIGGSAHSGQPRSTLGPGIDQRLGIPSIDIWFTADESKSLVRDVWDAARCATSKSYAAKHCPITLSKGGSESTYSMSFSNPASITRFSEIASLPDAQKNLAAAAAQARASGACDHIPRLDDRYLLNNDDIRALAARLKPKPTRAPQH